jgi:hypothetical protein
VSSLYFLWSNAAFQKGRLMSDDDNVDEARIRL